MNEEYLRQEIEKLEQQLETLKGEMRRALNYSKDDPKGALNKARIILESLLKDVYKKEMGKEPAKNAMLGALIAPNNKTVDFRSRIETPILTQMHYIQKLGNYGSHDNPDDLTQRTAMSGLNALCDIVAWYLDKYGVSDRNMNKVTEGVGDSVVNNQGKTKVIKQITNVHTTINGTMSGNHHLGIGNQNMNIQDKG